MFKLIEKKAATVKELIDILQEVPGDYSITPAGIVDFSVAVDDEDKCVLMDDTNWIEEDIYLSNEDIETKFNEASKKELTANV